MLGNRRSIHLSYRAFATHYRTLPSARAGNEVSEKCVSFVLRIIRFGNFPTTYLRKELARFTAAWFQNGT
jgi:hypothetical protein